MKTTRWLSPRTILSVDRFSKTFTVRGFNGKVICAAVKDLRTEILIDTFAHLVQEGVFELKTSLSDAPSSNVTHQPTHDSPGRTCNNEINIIEDAMNEISPTINDHVKIF